MSDKDLENNQSLPNKENDSPQLQGASAPTSPSTSNEIPIPGRTSPHGAMPGIAASPPQFVTMNEIMSTVNGLMNMQILHEIVLDKDFKLTPFQPPENSIEKVVKETMHRAFWDLLAEELNSDPPTYIRAMGLLDEVKSMLLDLLHPHHQHEKLRQEINEMIDIPFIEQQAKNEALDFLGYAQFIINVMGRLCAPARDDKIEELKQMSDPIQIYRGVLETLTLMRMDLANFEIEMFRSELTAQSVQYEKEKFAKAVAMQGGLASLIHTTKWLKHHVENTSNSSERDIILSAYLELFEWNLTEEFPETAAMDFKRITELGLRLKQLITAGTVLLVTLSRASWPPLQRSSAFKEKLLRDVCTLLEDVKTNEALKNILPNVAVQVINILKKQVEQEKSSDQTLPPFEVDDAFQQSLSELIQDIHRSDHSVRKVVKQRTNEFLRVSLSSAPNIPKQLPPGLTSLRSELLSATGSIIRLFKYNMAVFGDYYSQIIAKLKEEAAPVS